MIKNKLLFSVLFFTVLGSSINAQGNTENYLLFDAVCMKKYDFEPSVDYYDLAFWDFHMTISPKKSLVFRVLKQEAYLDETKALVKEPIRCSDDKSLNEDFFNDINNSNKTLLIAEYDKTKKAYQLYTVKKVIQYQETEAILKYNGGDCQFTYNKKKSKEGDNLDSTGTRVLYQGASEYNCVAQHQFRAYDKVQPRFYEDMYFADNLGLVKLTKEKGSLELKRINGVPVADYLKKNCEGKTKKEEKKEEKKAVKKEESIPAIDSMGLDSAGFYIVQSGDNLYNISKKFKTRVDVIMGLNKLQSTALSKGQKLKVKDDGSYKELNPIERKDDKTGAKMKVHIVRQGENLWDIANRYNTTTEKLMALNKMPNEKIDLFQELIIEIIK